MTSRLAVTKARTPAGEEPSQQVTVINQRAQQFPVAQIGAVIRDSNDVVPIAIFLPVSICTMSRSSRYSPIERSVECSPDVATDVQTGAQREQQ